MSDFRTRLGAQLGAAASRLARGSAGVDFRARLGAQLTDAIVELQRARGAAIVATGVAVLPGAGAGRPAIASGDFRARLGLQLTAASAQLALGNAAAAGSARSVPRAARDRVGARRRPRPADFRARFGIQLTASAAALAGARGGLAGGGAVARRRARSAVTGRVARPLALVVALTGLAGAATASSLWLVSVGNPNGGENPGLSATSPPRAQLAALAVLRRAQTAADRGAGVQTALEDVNDFTTGVRSNFVRVLEATAAGPVVLVPVAERDASPAGAVGGGASRAIPDALCIYYPIAGASALGSSPACWSTAQLLAGRAVSAADGRIFGLAPDGVGSVTIAVAGNPAVSVPVAGNFFDAPAPAPAPAVGGAPPPSKQPVVTLNRG